MVCKRGAFVAAAEGKERENVFHCHRMSHHIFVNQDDVAVWHQQEAA
jgi:hypothetical protein